VGYQFEEGVPLVMVDDARLDTAELAEEVLQFWFASPTIVSLVYCQGEVLLDAAHK
jgi:hypothetical protein